MKQKAANQDNMIFGTLVQYRKAGSTKVHEKEFLGDGHARNAYNFVWSHVSPSISDDEFEALDGKQRKLFEPRTVEDRNTGLSNTVYVRRKLMWDWHVFAPISKPVGAA